MKRHKRYWCWLVGLLLLLACSIAGCVTAEGEPTGKSALPSSFAPDTASAGAAATAGEFREETAGSDSIASTGTTGGGQSDSDVLIGCDPVSGGNQGVSFTWEQLCLSSQYQVQIAKDAGFSQMVFDSGAVATASATSPALLYPAGGAVVGMAITPPYGLEAGHTYYWRARVRQAATGQHLLSPWSEARSFTVKVGLPVRSQYYGLTLLSPGNGYLDCTVKPASFSWSPFKESTRYRFVLAKDAELTAIVVEAETETTAFEYDGTLDNGVNYFWRVMAVSPAPSDWSATFSFQTEAAPAPPPAPAPEPGTPLWVWVVIAVGAILWIGSLFLILKTRQV